MGRTTIEDAPKQNESFPTLNMFFIAFSVASSAQIVSPILAIYAKDYLGASISQVGLIVSAFFIASVISKLSIGLFSRGRWIGLLLSLGLLGGSIFPSAYALAGAPLTLAFIRILHGFAFSLFLIAGLTVASTMAPPEKRDEALGSYTAALALGLMAGPSIGTLGVASVGVRNTFFLASIVAFAGLLSSCPLLRRFGSTAKAEHSGVSKRNLVAVLANEVFRSAFVSYLAFSFLFGVILAYGPIYAHESLGFPNEHITSLFFGYFTLTAGVRFFMNRLTRQYGKKKLLVSGLVGATLITFFMTLSGSPMVFALAFILLGISHGVIYPTSAMIVAGSVTSGELLLANSIFLSAFDLGATLGPVLVSVVAERYGIVSALSISSIPATLAAVLVVRARSSGSG